LTKVGLQNLKPGMLLWAKKSWRYHAPIEVLFNGGKIDTIPANSIVMVAGRKNKPEKAEIMDGAYIRVKILCEKGVGYICLHDLFCLPKSKK